MTMESSAPRVKVAAPGFVEAVDRRIVMTGIPVLWMPVMERRDAYRLQPQGHLVTMGMPVRSETVATPVRVSRVHPWILLPAVVLRLPSAISSELLETRFLASLNLLERNSRLRRLRVFR